MAGAKKEPGPTAERAAAALRRIRRGRELTAAGLSGRLHALGHPIADTGITKAEQGTRRIDVDDLVPLALALGVTPNTLLMPHVDYLGGTDYHLLTPNVGGNAERLWQWAQGERAIPVPLPGLPSEFHDADQALEFTVRSRPYLTAARAPGGGGPGTPAPELRELSVAVQRALKAGAMPTEVRRVAELTMTMPRLMTDTEIDEWLEDHPRPGREGQ